MDKLFSDVDIFGESKERGFLTVPPHVNMRQEWVYEVSPPFLIYSANLNAFWISSSSVSSLFSVFFM